jgi:hypothetical protein
MDQKVVIAGSVSASATATADVRSSLTAQFLMAAGMQARSAGEIEGREPRSVTEDEKTYHRGLVVGAIMQAVAALECEIWEVMTYGPGHHLGSNGIDSNARNLLEPLSEMIDAESILDRYRFVLHILQKPAMNSGQQPWQDAALAIRLRNELVHFKSRWGAELERSKMLRALEEKKHPKAPFIEATNFFPHRCLNAACALWAVRSCIAFLDAFYVNLGVPDRLDAYRARFA